MKQLELNVIESFRMAKSDIIKVQSAINALSRKQEELLGMIDELRIKEAKLNEQVKNLTGKVSDNKEAIAQNKILASKKVTVAAPKPKTITKTRTIIKKVMVPQTKTIVKRVMVPSKRAKKHYVASKAGNKLHNMSCPFGKNIKPKLRVIYKTKAKAFNAGLKPCNCLKRV